MTRIDCPVSQLACDEVADSVEEVEEVEEMEELGRRLDPLSEVGMDESASSLSSSEARGSSV